MKKLYLYAITEVYLFFYGRGIKSELSYFFGGGGGADSKTDSMKAAINIFKAFALFLFSFIFC